MNNTEKLTASPAADALAMHDMTGVAYIKAIENDMGLGYAIFSAEGAELAIFPTRAAAYYTARQHDLEPFDVH